MNKNTSISLGEHFTRFVGEQLVEGRYGSASEVVRAGLRLLEEHEARLKSLRDALQQGEQSGKPMVFDRKKFFVRVRHGESPKK